MCVCVCVCVCVCECVCVCVCVCVCLCECVCCCCCCLFICLFFGDQNRQYKLCDREGVNTVTQVRMLFVFFFRQLERHSDRFRGRSSGLVVCDLMTYTSDPLFFTGCDDRNSFASRAHKGGQTLEHY